MPPGKVVRECEETLCQIKTPAQESGLSPRLLQQIDRLRYSNRSQCPAQECPMLRCRVPIAILVALTLPLPSFAIGTCCGGGQASCCSVSAPQHDGLTASCCKGIAVDAQASGCRNCAAARQETEQNATVVDRCSCHCKKNPENRPASDQRRELNFESFHTFNDTMVAIVALPAPSPLKVAFTDRPSRLRLHAIHCVWLN